MHLRIYKLSDVMTTIWPLKYTEAINFTLNKVSSIDVDVVKFFSLTLPFFKTFAIHMTVFKKAS